jgi:polar amino acid transport system substrate-binding protein
MIDFIDGKYVGRNIRVIELLAKELNKKLQFLKCPVARCLAMIENGQADMIVAIRKTPEREKYIGYLERPFEVQTFPLRFYLPFDSKLQIEHAKDLNNLSIGVLRGFTYFDSFDHNHELNKIAVTKHSQLINMLLNKRIDTFIEREQTIIPLIDKVTYETKMKLAQYQYKKSVDSYIGISKMSPFYQDIKLISKKLAELLDKGAIDQILNQK